MCLDTVYFPAGKTLNAFFQRVILLHTDVINNRNIPRPSFTIMTQLSDIIVLVLKMPAGRAVMRIDTQKQQKLKVQHKIK